MPKPLADKTALVTGASRGIGRAIATRLAGDGAHLFVHYNRSSKEADALVSEIEHAGGTAEAVAANFEDAASVNRLVADLKARLDGRKLDILVNNAGILETHALGDGDGDALALDRLFAVNVRAPYQLTFGLIDCLSSDARVLFVSSIAAKNVFPGLGAYALTKGAIDTLTGYLAAELGERGIRVNAIAPGLIETDMASDFLDADGSREWAKSTQALKRIGQTDDVARVAGFLAGSDSGWVTGQVIDASGGYRL